MKESANFEQLSAAVRCGGLVLFNVAAAVLVIWARKISTNYDDHSEEELICGKFPADDKQGVP